MHEVALRTDAADEIPDTSIGMNDAIGSKENGVLAEVDGLALDVHLRAQCQLGADDGIGASELWQDLRDTACTEFHRASFCEKERRDVR